MSAPIERKQGTEYRPFKSDSLDAAGAFQQYVHYVSAEHRIDLNNMEHFERLSSYETAFRGYEPVAILGGHQDPEDPGTYYIHEMSAKKDELAGAQALLDRLKSTCKAIYVYCSNGPFFELLVKQGFHTMGDDTHLMGWFAK